MKIIIIIITIFRYMYMLVYENLIPHFNFMYRIPYKNNKSTSLGDLQVATDKYLMSWIMYLFFIKKQFYSEKAFWS